MAAMVSPWGKPGAWALDSEEHDAQLLKEEEQQKKSELSLDFPSLNDALTTKQKKKGQTLSLAEFNAHGGSGSRSFSSQVLTHVDLTALPTGPRERTAEELDRNRLGGGFRNYGSNGSYERSNRYSNGDDSSNSKWGSSRVSDENRRNGDGSDREFTPSRADEVDNWALTKKPMAGNGFERRDRGVGFSDSQSSKADESESWVSNKSNVPSDGRRFGANGGFDRERRGGFGASGGGADSDTWGRKKEEGNTNTNTGGGGVGGRPKLNLQPRTLPVSEGKASEISGITARSKSSNPFGEARPREEVLAEKGHDWKKLDEQLDSKIKEVPVEKTEKSNAISFGKKSFGNGTDRAAEDRTERSWRKPESLLGSPESRPDSILQQNKGKSIHGSRRRAEFASFCLFLLEIAFFLLFAGANCSLFPIDEATIAEIQHAFSQNKLTSTKLLDHYLNKIDVLNPVLKSVLEVNPDARAQAEAADRERKLAGGKALGELHGIPVLLKDTIATKDRLNTTAGSFALLGSVVPRDAAVVDRLRNAGAVILGKSSLTEWYGSRSLKIPHGWCARGGQALNPYGKGGNPCGSSSGSAISVAANMVAISLGTETDGSILCPADYNSVVGIKPTVGLTSRGGVIPITPRQDTIGPICRTVSDAVYVLDAIVGFDPMDSEATKVASELIPSGGYKQFLRKDGLKGKRLGIVRHPFSDLYPNGSIAIQTFEHHVNLLRKSGATIVDNLQISNVDVILNPFESGEFIATIAEFKLAINDYLKKLIQSPVRSLADIIAFNNNHTDLENMEEYGQDAFLLSEQTDGIGETEKEAISMMENLSRDGFEEIMKSNCLDAMVTLGTGAETVLAIGGYPAISVPAGYEGNGEEPFGILFGGLKGTEPNLIEIAYAYEQATMVRRPPLLSELLSL